MPEARNNTGSAEGADHFEFVGDRLKMTYTAVVRTTAGPQEQLVVDYPDLGEPRTFTGEDIDKVLRGVGSLLTVNLEAAPDAETLALTLLLPTVHLGKGLEQAFATVAILTTIRSGFVPTPPEGPRQTYRVVPLLGKAKPNPF